MFGGLVHQKVGGASTPERGWEVGWGLYAGKGVRWGLYTGKEVGGGGEAYTLERRWEWGGAYTLERG